MKLSRPLDLDRLKLFSPGDGQQCCDWLLMEEATLADVLLLYHGGHVPLSALAWYCQQTAQTEGQRRRAEWLHMLQDGPVREEVRVVLSDFSDVMVTVEAIFSERALLSNRATPHGPWIEQHLRQQGFSLGKNTPPVLMRRCLELRRLHYEQTLPASELNVPPMPSYFTTPAGNLPD